MGNRDLGDLTANTSIVVSCMKFIENGDGFELVAIAV